MVQDDRLIDGKEAGRITGLKKSARYEWIAKGLFPKPIKVGRATRFSERECRQFVADRIAQRDCKS
jgi:prophage regulatory protein